MYSYLLPIGPSVRARLVPPTVQSIVSRVSERVPVALAGISVQEQEDEFNISFTFSSFVSSRCGEVHLGNKERLET